MADSNEIGALRAALRGAREAAGRLADVAQRIDGVGPTDDVPAADLEELQRLSLANALAAQGLRGFVESMLRRRGKLVEVAATGEGGIEE
jgi:hypothetical protein